MKKIVFFLLSLALLSACKQKISEFNVDKGSADFTKYIAIGNSLTAGYANGALYKSGQLNSIPNLIAGQLKLAGSGAFVQPIVNSEYGVGFPGSGIKLKLGYSTGCDGKTSLGPVPDIGTQDPLLPVGYDVNNFGVPGAKSFHIVAPHYGDPAGLIPPISANPYFVRFAKTPASSVLSDAAQANATFFTVWLGDNDVLSYGLSGGFDTITSPGFFQNIMGLVLQTLTANKAKGVVATIPDVTAIPFFTTIPYNGLVLTKNQADSVNMGMAIFNLPFVYKAGPNPFLVPDPTSPHPYFKVRQMVPGEMVLLTVPQDSLKCRGMGIIDKFLLRPYPIPKQYFLSIDDITKLQTATAAYNQILTGLAANFNLGVVDMNAKMKELQKGIEWDGISLNATFVSGGAFSLDGIHLTPRGCALAANFFIEAINKKYGSTIPEVDITKYPGVIFP